MSIREGKKMLNWIKKRCRRRSAPSGAHSDYEVITQHFESSVKKSGYEDITIHEVSQQIVEKSFGEENIYEEVRVREPEYDLATQIIDELSTLTDKIENDFQTTIICPICRKQIEKDAECSCPKTTSPSKKRKAESSGIEQATGFTYDLARPLPKLPRTATYNSISIYSDASSGYESLGSDAISVVTNQDLVSRLSEDFDDEYEEMNPKPHVELKRVQSVNGHYISYGNEKHPNLLHKVEQEQKVKTIRKVSRGKRFSLSFRS
ncbi:hypothetical protein LOTGIDRAFT_171777 [Lottia gigantea]|uniref:Uncharacterized protein n=1 Tax=Lottia gigantea TaxID=225164 RepID=V4BA44_LOTGI|nr:hypothetical protein LOTGIDRAFT_171777 [Lottia gigantea]ESP02702.1 hypothetical protein LOTGIDRAFT_171777 [Lottia gigantea]